MEKLQYIRPDTYAVKLKNTDQRMKSRSGGIFTAISDEIINNGGVVYGCILDDKFKAVHVRAETKELRDSMRGSKYVQSDLSDTFLKVKKDLESGRQVLFSGTSCQVAGLKAFLDNSYDNLWCIDIVCHGVASPLVYKKFLEWQTKKYGNIDEFEFRNKKDFGWASHFETTTIYKNRKIKKINGQMYTKIYYQNSVIRPACYQCPYKSIIHPGNITIADYWGIDKIAPDFNDNKGVSLVLVNDDKGNWLFQQSKDSISYIKTRLEDSLQQPLIAPYEKPKNRDQVWQDFYDMPFAQFAKKYGKSGIVQKFKVFISHLRFKYR